MQSRLLNLLIVLILIKFGHSSEFVLFICEVGTASATSSLFNWRTLDNFKSIDDVGSGCWRVSVKDYTAAKCADFCITRLTNMQWLFKDGQGERKKMPRERTERIIKEDRERSARRARKSIREAALLLGADRMLTLTFADCVKDLDKAGAAFKEFVNQVNKQFHGNKREMQYVCTFERQERGAIHFHLALNRFYYWKTLLELWQFAIAKAGLPFIINKHDKRQYGGIFINQKCKDKTKSGIASYIAKYIGKQDGKGLAEHGELVSKGEKRFWQSKISRASLVVTKLYHENIDAIAATLTAVVDCDVRKIYIGENYCKEPIVCGEIDYSKHKGEAHKVTDWDKKGEYGYTGWLEFGVWFQTWKTLGAKVSVLSDDLIRMFDLSVDGLLPVPQSIRSMIKARIEAKEFKERLEREENERLNPPTPANRAHEVYDFSHINKMTVTLRDKVGQIFEFTALNSTIEGIKQQFWQYEIIGVV
jgi:hypothetical protein